MAERARAAALAAAVVVAVLGAFAAKSIGMDSRFAPNRSGTLLPDGTPNPVDAT